MRGKLIVFEGIEGCGKTTQLDLLHEWLVTSELFQTLQRQGIASQVCSTKEPGGTELGLKLRQLLLNGSGVQPIQDRAELLLFAADRAQHVEESFKPLLAEGALILCDRYIDSTIAYQGYGRGLDLDLIHQLNQIATQGLQSDLTLWLDLDVTDGLARTQQRGAADRIEQADLAFHQRVRKGFKCLALDYPQNRIRINAGLSVAEVSRKVQLIVEQQLRAWYQSFLNP